VHSLLARQLRRFQGDPDRPPADWKGFLQAVEAAYEQVEADRALLERSMVLASNELHERNEQLRSEMRDRARMESELRMAQKLESVGQLAAGIAHEINSPVQYIGDSLAFLEDAQRDLFGFVARCRRVEAALRERELAAELVDSIESAARAADLEFLSLNVPPAVERARAGVDRVARIVRALKEFAHPGERDMTPTDVNRAIETTLVVATNEYKYVADVVTDLGELPPVRCNGGELNQVLLNLVVNAAHAVADAHRDRKQRGTIRVSSRADGDDVVITVADDGCGIPETIRERVFDPFFTTKEVGRGTGQGLTIARTIVVDRHRGKLEFESEVGQGTTFRVRLPIAGAPAATAA
jgi:signal transduction histidine kinase